MTGIDVTVGCACGPIGAQAGAVGGADRRCPELGRGT